MVQLLFALPLFSFADVTAFANLTGRYDYLTAEREAMRMSAELEGELITESFLVSSHLFVETDFFEGWSVERRARDVFRLYEAYGEYHAGEFYVRAGLQPVRWSESWTIPSLDIWTQRYWNRLFLDSEHLQLAHPSGGLVTWAVQGQQVDLFLNVEPAEPLFPVPLSQAVGEGLEVGARYRTLIRTLQVSVVAAHQNPYDVIGLGLSIPYEEFVFKTEGALTSERDRFLSVGVDYLTERWTITPQLTVFRSEATSRQRNTQAFVSVKYDDYPYNVESRFLKNFDNKQLFASLSLTRYLSDVLWASIFIQDYEGPLGTLFGLYQSQVGDSVIGFRLEYKYGI